MVLDDHHGRAQRADRRDKLAQPVELGQRQARRRLVEQQQARPADQRAGDLGQALLAVRQLARRLHRAIGEADEIEVAQGIVQRGRLLAPRPRQAERRRRGTLALGREGAEQRVVEHAELRQHSRRLEGAADAVAGDAVRRHADD